MICLFSTSFSHGSNLSNLVRILFKLRDKLSHTASPRHGSGGISPVAAYRSEQPGAVCQGCTAPPLLRWLALDWRHRLFYFPAARRGYILQSRILSHDWERAGDWVEHQRRFASVDKGIHNKTTKYGLPTYWNYRPNETQGGFFIGRERRYPYKRGLTVRGQALFSCHQIRRRKCEWPMKKQKS